MKIAIISDTHDYIDERIIAYCAQCDEIWHAGDFGNFRVLEELRNKAGPVIGVYGNVDDQDIRAETPLHQWIEREGLSIWMTHIGGRPGNYSEEVREKKAKYPADIFVCGHSHILKVQRDSNEGWIYINPGAAGKTGFHKVRTMMTLELKDGKIDNPQVIELEKRGKS